MKKLLIAFIALVLITCGEEEIKSRAYPRVRTHAIDNITSSGAALHAEITFTSAEIIDHGFVFSMFNSPTLENAEVFSLGPKSGKGKFQSIVERGLAEGVKYYVRGYAQSNDHTVYGEVKEFISLGSMAPVLTNIFPLHGNWGDTIVFKGKNFSRVNPNFEIKFDEAKAVTTYASDTLMKAIVPDKLLIKKSSVSVSFDGNISTLTNAFELSVPVIHSVNPPSGAYKDQIVITGRGFNGTTSNVYFGSKQAVIAVRSNKLIICNVPKEVPFGSVKLSINPGVESLIVQSDFFSNAPHINSITPLQATFNDEITIMGENFGSTISSNTVKFGNTVAEVTYASPSEIRVKVPYSLDTPEHTITLISNLDETIFEDKFRLSPPVITTVSPDRVASNIVVTITGNNFNPNGGNVIRFGSMEADYLESISETEIKVRVPINIYSHTFSLYVTTAGQTTEYGNISSPWIKLPDFPESIVDGISFVHNGYAYLGLGQAGGTYYPPYNSKIWKFDPTTKSVTQLSEFPGSQRKQSVFFKLGNKGYVGGGIYDNYPMNDFWEYDFDSDQWEQKNDLPFPYQSAYGAVGFSVDSYAFVMLGNEFWQYDATTDTWIYKSYFPGDYRFYQKGFSHNGELYVFGGNADSFPYYPVDMWKYNVSSDVWTYLGDVPEELSLRPFVFEINNEIYIGDYGGNEENNFWKYDPQSNEFSKQLSYSGNGQDGSFNFVIDGKGYLFTGNEIINATVGAGSNCWMFDPDF